MPAMSTHPVIKRLPSAYYTQIGRLVSRWSYFEWRLQQLAYLILGIEPKIGRVAIREPRVVDYLTMIEDILFLRYPHFRVNMGKFKTTVGTLESYGDKLAHGLWVKHRDSTIPVLRDIKGKHQNEPHPQNQKARINPKAVAVAITDIRDWNTALSTYIRLIEQLQKKLAREIKSSRGKHRQQPPRGNAANPANHKRLRRLPPPLPLQG